MKALKNYYVLYLFLIPALILTLLFNYLPLFSNIIAFMDYDIFAGWMGLGSKWVGFKNFAFLGEGWFYELLVRTIYYNITILLFSFPASIILALLLNEVSSNLFKKISQSISYIPHFVSWVTVAGLTYIFLSYDNTGLVNNLMTTVFGTERAVYMQDNNIFLPLLIITQTWKEIGWGSILYLAAITMIDPQLYEAATMDGAGRWRRMFHITLPGLIPTTVVLLIFSLAGLIGGNFDQIFNLQNQVIQDQTNTISTFTYYEGILGARYSFSTAVGLFQGLVSFILLYIANYYGKKTSGTSII
ncbi:ABC transporter permease [Paenibacillus montanisoli]|uniref:Sugar ABC transporter permease n=1 Tax=Paenibacillus montanisoli TaxID=2081970 RepID=A0A328U7V1_9BACL|nr:ABC transporter permease subunit [Paenibacillus montanisoli]RAP77893.1 sugar ABC transporter permease [Paenibacillus montanisoli]